MTIRTTIHRGPLNPSAIISNPILEFYAKYAKDFRFAKSSTPPTAYYSTASKLINTDATIIFGAQAIWDYYIALYGQFERCEYEVISLTVIHDDETGKHTLTGEFLNTLHLKDNKGTVTLPQTFIYEIANAEEGCGTDGLQIWEVRCYFDRGILHGAATL
ncbi:uncharacterized protein CDV56_102926 [Aspergillus thermomutatus]|uniref:SnoaL-like domain-containing protein n=1 Tax=Aspergillus thermomutatus TaxID=41047 RepID=A0A397G333_ASPTH|nr:uncharacterized protein CDV56_102926 [Aspergillus thermomutatus]RHZ45037.1 hypothetical protein CDV56_102926 [Aspergillus thermomutatus]